MVTGSLALSANPTHFRNWDAGWLALYDAEGFLRIDPLIRWPIVSGEPGVWSEIYAHFPPRDPGRKVLQAAKDFGYHEGYVTPVRTREGAIGFVSVAGGRRAGFRSRERIYLEVISTTLLRHAEALLAPDRTGSMPAPLSMREQECISLLRQGLTDGEIANVLRVSAATVRGHLDQARSKLGARNRTHLAVTFLSGPGQSGG